MKKQFKMTEEDMKAILEACKPIPAIALQCGTPPSQQEMANNAWEALGKKLGFDYMTVEPDGRNKLCFLAEEVTETIKK